MPLVDSCSGADAPGATSTHAVPNLVPAAPEGATWVDLCGVRVTRLEEQEFLALARGRLADRRSAPMAIGSVNLDHIHHFGRRRKGHARLSGVARDPHWLLLADGAPISRQAGRVSGGPWPRLTGADVLPLMLGVAQETSTRVGFLGGTTDSVAALQDRLGTRWPDLRVAGCWTPPRADLMDATRSSRLAAQIRRAGADLLVVGLGKPLQERWIDEHGAATGARVLAGFGSAADFLGGSTRRAPRWMRSTGCEWLFRLAAEPRRLSYRYLVQGPAAMYRLTADRPGPVEPG